MGKLSQNPLQTVVLGGSSQLRRALSPSSDGLFDQTQILSSITIHELSGARFLAQLEQSCKFCAKNKRLPPSQPSISITILTCRFRSCMCRFLEKLDCQQNEVLAMDWSCWPSPQKSMKIVGYFVVPKNLHIQVQILHVQLFREVRLSTKSLPLPNFGVWIRLVKISNFIG